MQTKSKIVPAVVAAFAAALFILGAFGQGISGWLPSFDPSLNATSYRRTATFVASVPASSTNTLLMPTTAFQPFTNLPYLIGITDETAVAVSLHACAGNGQTGNVTLLLPQTTDKVWWFTNPADSVTISIAGSNASCGMACLQDAWGFWLEEVIVNTNPWPISNLWIYSGSKATRVHFGNEMDHPDGQWQR